MLWPGTAADGEAWPPLTATRQIAWRYPPTPPAESLRLEGWYGRADAEGAEHEHGDGLDEWESDEGWEDEGERAMQEDDEFTHSAHGGAVRAAPTLLPRLFD